MRSGNTDRTWQELLISVKKNKVTVKREPSLKTDVTRHALTQLRTVNGAFTGEGDCKEEEGL